MTFQKIEPGIWKPENDGDMIVGKLLRVEDSKSFKNKVYALEIAEGLDTEQKIVFGSTVLDDRMSFVHTGDIVKIVFKGTQKNKKGQDTKVFEVLVDRK